MKKSRALEYLKRKMRPELVQYGPDGFAGGPRNFWEPRIGFTSAFEKSVYELFRDIKKAESKDDDDLDKNFEIRLFHLGVAEKNSASPAEKIQFIQEEMGRIGLEFKSKADKNEIFLFMIMEDFFISKNPATLEKFLADRKPALNPEIWHLIAEKGTPQIAELFLNHHRRESKSADDNPLLTALQQPKGNTPIYSAVGSQNLPMFLYLRSLGARASQKNNLGETLLHALCESTRQDPRDAKAEHEILNELTLTYPAITDELNNRNETPLMLAFKAGNYHISRELILGSPTDYYIKGSKSIIRSVYELELYHSMEGLQAAELLLLLDDRRELPSRLAYAPDKVFLGEEENKLHDKEKLKKILVDALPKIFEKSYGDAFDEKKCQETINQWDEDMCRVVLTHTQEAITALRQRYETHKEDINLKRAQNLEKYVLPMLHIRINEFNRSKESLADIPNALLDAILAGDEKNIQRALQNPKLSSAQLTAEINAAITQAKAMARDMHDRSGYYRGIVYLISQTLDRDITKEIYSFAFLIDLKEIPRPPMAFCIKELRHAKESKWSSLESSLSWISEHFKSEVEKKEKDTAKLDSCEPFVKDMLLDAALNGDLKYVTYICNHFKNNPHVALNQIAGEIIPEFFQKLSEYSHYYETARRDQTEQRMQCIKFLASIATIPTLAIDKMPETMRPLISEEMQSRQAILPFEPVKLKSIGTYLQQTIQNQSSPVKKDLNSFYRETHELKREVKSKVPPTPLEKCWELIITRRKELSILHSTYIDATTQSLIIFRNFIDGLAQGKTRDAIMSLVAGINIISQNKASRELFLPSFLAILNLPPDTKNISEAIHQRLHEILDHLPLQFEQFKTFLDSHPADLKLFTNVSDKMKMKWSKELGVLGDERKHAVTPAASDEASVAPTVRRTTERKS